MRILDRYILKSVFSIFLLCLATFIFLYLTIDTFSLLDSILKSKVNAVVLARYYLTYIPIIFTQVTPISCLLAILYTFGKLNRNNEIIAMRASGLSIFQISKTVIIFGLLMSLAVFVINNEFVPSCLSLNQKIREEIESGQGTRQKNEPLINLCIYGLKNRLFFINKFIPATNTMEGICILEHDSHQNLRKKIVANKGVYENNFWKFYQVITYEFDESGQTKLDPRYSEDEVMSIPETPHDFITQRQKPEFMNIAQLDDYIWKLSKSGATTVIRKFEVDLYDRFASALTSFIIIFLGIPFALKIKKRAAGLSSLGLAILMSFLYYVFSAVCLALGKSGVLMPFLAVSLSHLTMFCMGLYLIHNSP